MSDISHRKLTVTLLQDRRFEPLIRTSNSNPGSNLAHSPGCEPGPDAESPPGCAADFFELSDYDRRAMLAPKTCNGQCTHRSKICSGLIGQVSAKTGFTPAISHQVVHECTGDHARLPFLTNYPPHGTFDCLDRRLGWIGQNAVATIRSSGCDYDSASG